MPDRPTDEMQVAVDKLSDEFAGVHDRAVVERAVERTRDELVPAKVDAFLPLLVHRYARESLRAAPDQFRQVRRRRAPVEPARPAEAAGSR